MSAEKETVIDIKGLKIDYRGISHFSIQQMIKNPALRGAKVVHALRGIDLEVKHGEVLGIIGENGAGKSTLLKAVAGIFQPDEGSIDTHGRRVSLMSIGVGFKWELSGRDNIMLAGLLLRYPKSYIKEKMQEIIDFSELGDAVDRPVRTYSSGMYSRLGFAITAVLETDVMLIDEILSVGDESFQAKSYRRMRELVNQDGMTAIIVSHDTELIKEICTRVVWMSDGKIQASGSPEEIGAMYLRASAASGAQKLTINDPAVPEGKKGTLLYGGLCVNEKSGLLENSAEGMRCTVNWEPVRLRPGDSLSLKRNDVLYRVFYYGTDIAPEQIYTKVRSPEGIKTVYDPERSGLFWREDPFTVYCDGYYRFEFLRKGEEPFGADIRTLDDIFEIVPASENTEEENERRRRIFAEAISGAVSRAESLRKPGDAVIIMLADTHFGFGGTWDDTAFCIREMLSGLLPDAVVHFGDLTDGVYPPALLESVTERMLGSISGPCPVYLCAGNHDLEMPERLIINNGAHSCADLPQIASAGRRFADIPDKKLRLIFLSSFDPSEEISYGFSKDDASWLRKTLKEMPQDHRAVVFSHIDPSSEETSWGEPVRGGNTVCEVLRAAVEKRPGCIYSVFCGHDHRDRIRKAGGFDIVSIGSASLTDHIGCRPLHDGSYSRRPDDTTQELFDIVILHAGTGDADLVRFGFGEDRKAGHDD